MDLELSNWKVQIRKGYLELCILLLIAEHKRIYGFDLLEKLTAAELETKEGTLYPLLNRMTTDGVLESIWETDNLRGHPRKYYSLSKQGHQVLANMSAEFSKMIQVFEAIKK